MFGALKLHGPVLTTVDEDNNLNGVGSNPYTWARKHNVIYIDNPVGAGEMDWIARSLRRREKMFLAQIGCRTFMVCKEPVF